MKDVAGIDRQQRRCPAQQHREQIQRYATQQKMIGANEGKSFRRRPNGVGIAARRIGGKGAKAQNGGNTGDQHRRVQAIGHSLAHAIQHAGDGRAADHPELHGDGIKGNRARQQACGHQSRGHGPHCRAHEYPRGTMRRAQGEQQWQAHMMGCRGNRQTEGNAHVYRQSQRGHMAAIVAVCHHASHGREHEHW